jgi:hypothetical protein
MKKYKPILLKLLSAFLAIGLISFVLSSILFMDFATSLEPGWHTTIYPFGGIIQTIIVISLFICVAYLIYKLILRVLCKFWL